MKQFLKTLGVTASALTACCALSLSASAATIEDVCNALREIGIPEATVQECMNYYYTCEHDANGTYDQNGNYYAYDDLVSVVYDCQDMIREKVFIMFPGGGSTAVTQPATTTAATTTTATTRANVGTTAQNQDPAAVSTTSATTTTVVTTTTQKAFINMTMAEKQAYVGAMSESERTDFLNGLTTAERNSIIKQMSAADKADIAQGFIDVMKQMGFNMTVDDIDNLGVSVHDQNGTLIDSASIVGSVDDTGWNMTAPFVISVSALLLSVGGLVWMTIHTANRQKKEQTDG